MNLSEKYPRETGAWSNMKRKAKREGIPLSSEWVGFAGFLSDMGEQPQQGMSVFRRDESLGFSKENCYWGFRGETHYTPAARKKFPGAFRSWKAMWNRCRTPSYWKRDRYQNRGIKVCTRWRSFDDFVADMGERPRGMSIDRINNDKGYSPENCRWATQSQQVTNRAPRDRYWERNDFTPKSATTIGWRVKHLGMTKEEAETTPLRATKKCQCIETGEVFPSMALAERTLGLPKNSVTASCKKGYAAGGFHFRLYKESSTGV